MAVRVGMLLSILLATQGAPIGAIEPAPLRSFAEQPPPPAPDYALPESWAARPGREGAASAVPTGATPAGAMPRVDVFYVHPTTDRSKTQWNQDVTDTAINGWTDASVIARQASVFNACCRVYAPRYRQATSRAFASMAESGAASGTGNGAGDGAKAYALAYQDVARAFAYYLRHDNHGRPFILAGHSQGGLHVAKLIETMIEGKPLARRMVAAYVIGYSLTEGAFGTTYKTVPVCASPTQTGCIVQWNAVLKGSKLAAVADGPPLPVGKATLCINPLTFDRARAVADAGAALGAIPGDPGYGPIAALRPRAVSATCRNGLLVVDPAADLDLKPLPGGIMHYHDIGLFYADMRANALLRSQAFVRRAGKHQ